VIYYFLYPLHEQYAALSAFNVLRYIPFRALAATMTSLLLTFCLYPWFIRRLQALQIGQVIRKDGPESHFSKAGTPTMGGALILVALVGSTLLWADPRNIMVWLVVAVTTLYGAIGFVDDSAKIRKKHSAGLSGRTRLILEFVIALAVCCFLWFGEDRVPVDFYSLRDRLAVPFLAFNKHPIYIPVLLYMPLACWVIVGTANAVNLTDGLDGLAIGPVIINAGAYLLLSYIAGVTFFGRDMAHYLDIPSLGSVGELAVYCGAMIGAGVGFLWYNTYPAQVFMGDVGSLALGGGLGALAVLTKNELLSVLQGGIFVLETVSVIGQVASFRLFKKRIFLMAPIHHHFEKKGWAEPKIIVRFWIISIMLALLSLSSLKLR